MAKTRILFVCHGNICRSPMAEMVMKHLVREAGREGEFEIASAATRDDAIGWDVHSGTRRELAAHGVECERRAARRLRRGEAGEWDHVAVMDGANLRDARAILGEGAAGKVRLLMEWAGEARDVADPWYTGDFGATWRDVREGCGAMLAALGGAGE